MSTLTDVLIVIGLFVLRIGIPIAVIVILHYACVWLDRRRQGDVRAQTAAARPVVPAGPQPAQRLVAHHR